MSAIDLTPYRRTGKLAGRCTCGAVTLTVDGNYIAAVGACHCVMCQRSTGTVFMAFEAAADAVTVQGPAKSHATSPFAERAFCGTCGSNLWLRNIGADTEYELLPGLFPDAAGFPLISEIYMDRCPSYMALKGDHPRRTAAEYEAKNLFVEGDAQ
jgi:hypothetical protein